MKPRKLKLVAMVSGFPTAIAEVHIQNFASEPELKDWTELVCRNCKQPTEYHGATYECKACSQTYSWWGKLLRVLKGSITPIEMPRLIKEKEIATGQLYKMKRVDFAKYCDATKAEKGVIVSDSGSAHNLFKLLVACLKLDYIIIVRYADTYEQVVALLEVSESNRIILKEIIPVNLVQIKETLMLDRSEISEQDVTEAGQFLQAFIPEALEQNLKVDDFRTAMLTGEIGVEKPEREKEKVVQIKEIMAMAMVKKS